MRKVRLREVRHLGQDHITNKGQSQAVIQPVRCRSLGS